MTPEEHDFLRRLELATSREELESDAPGAAIADEEWGHLREGWLSLSHLLEAAEQEHEPSEPVVAVPNLGTVDRAVRFGWGWSCLAVCVALLLTVWGARMVLQYPAAATVAARGKSQPLPASNPKLNTYESPFSGDSTIAADGSPLAASDWPDAELAWDDEVDEQLALVGALVGSDSELMRNADWSWLQLESDFRRMSFELHEDSL